ncbi:serine hydrolase [Deinococcus multiflagellatus]|uniref:Serine hydrolase n=1 Tax=Deinococcus multiflagellatus TaxID=1656887 RepID=A0ABW1ZSQ1_9DEIO|nr:serine hydrolase [Deinococcus multiflagellatus]MBZ9714894.1 serine hydrolase [Deinococcus multiflagellatus]
MISRVPSTLPLPAGVTGRVSFYVAEYDNKTKLPLRALVLGDPQAVHPLASLFKPLIVQALFQDVDAGKVKLNATYTTTAANRSIELYPPGTNSLQVLAKRAIYQSDNTASDILHLAYGPERLARAVRLQSPCTSVLLTTKAWWGAQAGLIPSVMTRDTAAGARAYGAQPFEQRVQTAKALIAASQKLTGPSVEQQLDVYFHGPTYASDMELNIQNTSTASAYTDLMYRTLSGNALKTQTRAAFRTMLATGCCRPKAPKFNATYWAGKAGSGWGILTLTGYVEGKDGRVYAYTYLNDGSVTTDSEDMELQIRPVVLWIEQNLLALQARR